MNNTQNQIMVKMVLDSWNSNIQSTNKLLSQLSDEQLMQEVAPGRNRGIYLLGHLAAVNNKMLTLLNLGEEMYPDLTVPFLAKADKEVNEIPSASELRTMWKSINDALDAHFAKLSPENWFEKHTSVSADDFAKEPHRNRLNVIISRSGHLAYHNGQLSFLKTK